MLEAVVGNPEVPQASVAFIFTCSARWNAAAGTKRQMTWENMAPDGRESPDDLRGERHRYPFGLPCVGGIALL